MIQTLDAVRFPLWGSRLIEASAGTGKTWTIAALYLRLILGHGGEEGFGRPLAPSEILVMTFTRAATRELSDRIRARLLAAARCFQGETAPEADDPLLTELLSAFPAGEARASAAWRLAMAADGMDDAAVHTIDAWCQRMLREHAFDSGCLFDEKLLADDKALTREACRDYWRQQLYPMADAMVETAVGVWPTVERLTEDVQELLRHRLPDGAGDGTLAQLIERVSAQRAAALTDLKRGWPERAQEMQVWLDQQMAAKKSPFNKVKLKSSYYTPWLTALADWAETPAIEKLDITEKGLTRLVPAGMRAVMTSGDAVELPAHFAAFEQLLSDLERLPTLQPALRLHAAACVAQRLGVLKRQAGTFGFDDMLTRLDAALTGPNAEALRARIVKQHPVALIDEFQDTSPVQSRIFDALYRIEQNDRATALLLIGDPKQSIYGFRNADIHSYLKARRATAGRHYVLGTNHRSTAALVHAVNHVFGHAEGTHRQGAFMFRGESGDNPLPFMAVKARGRAERLVTSAGPCPALALHHETELLDKKTSLRRFAARCAEHIALLLDDAQAGFEDRDRGFVQLQPADIAVLVRTGTEAAAVRNELRLRDVASVYLSERDSVFESGEAGDLLHWLSAVAAPRDTRLVRAGLATRLAGLSMPELLLLATDDAAFDERSELLRRLHRVWKTQGVLTMLRQTLHLLELPVRWLAEPERERRLTNFLHLSELLQTASARLDGPQALIRWLAARIEEGRSMDDERIVRLESDAGLVKVVTVHKSKGLEYPVVFLPFPCHFRPVDKARTKAVSLADDNGDRCLHLQLSDEVHRAAEHERHREDVRLLYVALTRARHAVWVGFSALKIGNAKVCTSHRSAIGFALAGSDPVHEDTLPGHLERMAGPCPDIAVIPAQTPIARTRVRSRGRASELRAWPPYAGDFERHWSIGSFSALVRSIQTPVVLSGHATHDDETLATPDGLPASMAPGPTATATATGKGPTSVARPWHAFPRGTASGDFLHGELEWLAGERFDLKAPATQQQLLRRCERQGWGHRGEEVLAWLQKVVETPLPPLGVSLDSVTTRLPEMEFWFPSDGLMSRDIDVVCQSHLLGDRPRPALPERRLQGMLMGFADLVFEHGGRYWVLDYKSNHLGPQDEDYGHEALEAAMAAHRYDVQAALYLLALHRLLRARLGAAYDPERHLGGALFYFLRGVEGPANGCYRVEPQAALLDRLDELAFRPEEAAA